MLGVDVAHHRFCQEELVTVGTVLPGEGGLRRARPPCVRQGHVGGLARGPQGPGGGGGYKCNFHILCISNFFEIILP